MRRVDADSLRGPRPADPLLEARQPLEVTIDGQLYRARPLSLEAVLRYEAACLGGTPGAREAALTWLLRLAFGYRVSYWWRGDPVRRILRHPERAKVIAGFFPSLTGRASSTPSSPPTSRPPRAATRGTAR